jgi:hypothetical protein
MKESITLTNVLKCEKNIKEDNEFQKLLITAGFILEINLILFLFLRA